MSERKRRGTGPSASAAARVAGGGAGTVGSRSRFAASSPRCWAQLDGWISRYCAGVSAACRVAAAPALPNPPARSRRRAAAGAPRYGGTLRGRLVYVSADYGHSESCSPAPCVYACQDFKVMPQQSARCRGGRLTGLLDVRLGRYLAGRTAQASAWGASHTLATAMQRRAQRAQAEQRSCPAGRRRQPSPASPLPAGCPAARAPAAAASRATATYRLPALTTEHSAHSAPITLLRSSADRLTPAGPAESARRNLRHAGGPRAAAAGVGLQVC